MSMIYSDIANHLLKTVEKTLYEPISGWINTKEPRPRVAFRIGSGQKTYIRYTHENEITYTFGVKNIQQKHDIFNIGRWLSTDEIIKRNYFDCDITYINLLTHVALHEHSHVIQRLSNTLKEETGSHNNSFYRALDRIHESEYKQNFIDELSARMIEDRLPMRFLNGVERLPKEQILFWQRMDKGIDVEGEQTSFILGEELISGRIVKVNPKRTKIHTDRGGLVNMPKFLLFDRHVANELYSGPR